MKKEIEFTRVNNDINGNPRFVFHFLSLVNDGDRIKADTMKGGKGLHTLYEIAIKKAHKIGGRKFHNKQYGGGIVVSSYNLQSEEKAINELQTINANFIKEWQPKDFKKVETAIRNHFTKYTYKAITDRQKPAQPFVPYSYTQIDSLLGFAYTSTGAYAGYWVCNGVYLMANKTHHFTGFALNSAGEVIAIAQDENENEILIQL